MTRLLYRLETHIDELRARLRARLGIKPGAVVIVPYRGFGDARRLTLSGRVLTYRRAPALDNENDKAALWTNLIAAYRRFETDELPGALVRATYGALDAETVTDEEGYFHFDLRPNRLLDPGAIWQSVDLVHPAPHGAAYAPARAAGQVLVPAPTAGFGVISDIDDTVLQSGVVRPLEMLRNVLLRSARQRLPFAGVAEFYQALHAGPSGRAGNPIFYVSSSPWNLYDLLVDFMEINDIPAGPLLLRDIGIEADRFIISSHHNHKSAQIARILDAYPNLDFVLLGDSGQHDPEIYARTVSAYPRRIRAVYIRHVASPARGAAIKDLARRVQAEGVDLLLADDSAAVARHAAHIGLIAPGALPIIEAACRPAGTSSPL
jgi:phosphatidate phosphatase APP1